MGVRYPQKRPGFRNYPDLGTVTTAMGLTGFTTANYYESASGTSALLKSSPWSFGIMFEISGALSGASVAGGRHNDSTAGGTCFRWSAGSSAVLCRCGNGTTTYDSATKTMTANQVYILVGTFDGTNLKLIEQAGQIGASTAAGYSDPDGSSQRLAVGIRGIVHDRDAETMTLYGFCIGNTALSAGDVATWAADCKAAFDVTDFPTGHLSKFSVRQGLSSTPGSAPSTWNATTGTNLAMTLTGSLSVVENTPTWGNVT